MELIIGGGISIMGSLLLWFFLPRGVVLTSAELPYGEDDYEPPYDELGATGTLFRVKNESPLPVKILKATISGFMVYETTGGPNELDVTDTYDEHLILDADYGDPRWRGHITPPGNTFLANVHLNTTLKIKYRRAGWSGVFERRLLVIFGGL